MAFCACILAPSWLSFSSAFLILPFSTFSSLEHLTDRRFSCFAVNLRLLQAARGARQRGAMCARLVGLLSKRERALASHARARASVYAMLALTRAASRDLLCLSRTSS